jgi:hypothetical protein
MQWQTDFLKLSTKLACYFDVQGWFSAASIAFLNRSVLKRSWQPGQQLPGFLNQLTVLLIFMPHLGQVT